MFLITFSWVQALIVFGVVVLFFGSIYLNRRTKAPEGVEVPEKCTSCISTSCFVKKMDSKQILEEIKCEEENEKK